MFSLKDLTKVTKTSSGDLREKTKCAVNRVLIGKVLCPNVVSMTRRSEASIFENVILLSNIKFFKLHAS